MSITQNQQIQVGNKDKQTFDLDMAEITPSTLDEYPGTSTAIRTESEKKA